MKLETGLYISRAGIVYNIQNKVHRSIWPFEGEDELGNSISWTHFGGSSSSYDCIGIYDTTGGYDVRYDSELEQPTDLIKKVTREEYPEYFL